MPTINGWTGREPAPDARSTHRTNLDQLLADEFAWRVARHYDALLSTYLGWADDVHRAFAAIAAEVAAFDALSEVTNDRWMAACHRWTVAADSARRRLADLDSPESLQPWHERAAAVLGMTSDGVACAEGVLGAVMPRPAEDAIRQFQKLPSGNDYSTTCWRREKLIDATLQRFPALT